MGHVTEKYPGCVLVVREEYVEVELYVTPDQSRTVILHMELETVPLDLRDYGHAIWIIVQPDLQYTLTHRTFCVTEKMQKAQDELEEIVKTFH